MTQESDSRVEDSCGIPRAIGDLEKAASKQLQWEIGHLIVRSLPCVSYLGRKHQESCLFDGSGRLKHKCRFDCQKPILGDIDDSDNDAKQLGQKVKVNMRAKVNQAKSPFSLFSSVLPLLHLFLFLAPNVSATPASVWVLYSLSEYFSSCNDDDDDDWIKLLC